MTSDPTVDAAQEKAGSARRAVTTRGARTSSREDIAQTGSDYDPVDAVGDASFPASDPPSWWSGPRPA